MKDIMSIQRGSVVDKTGRTVPIVRIRRVPANKYSARYMALAKKVAP